MKKCLYCYKELKEGEKDYHASCAFPEVVLTLMVSVAMEHKAFEKLLPNITCNKTLLPD